MAKIVELKQYDNVTLGRGVMQNWVDLDVDGPSWKPLVANLVSGVGGDVLVVGPHDVQLLESLAKQAARLVVVVRSAPDAATIATAVPAADVRAGNVGDCIDDGERFDAVIMLDDVSRVLSAEEADRPWADLTEEIFSCAKPEAHVFFSVENERGLHRQSGTIDTYAVNFDRDWTPFRTWDATRPRTVAQLQSWLAATGRTEAQLWSMFPTLRGVTALTSTASPVSAFRDLAAAYSLRGWSSPLPLRSAALAGLMDDVAAGWIVCLNSPQVDEARTISPGQSMRTWMAAGEGLISAQGETIRPPKAGRTMLMQLIEMAADGDTPGMRGLLRAWRAAVAEETSAAGVVNAERADARLSNVYFDGESALAGNVVFLEPAAEAGREEEVLWSALGDALSVIQSHGLKHPWSNAMNRQTRLASLGAMAGLKRPENLQPYLSEIKDRGQTREELLAVVKRQQDELRSVWARWHWDEKQYATFVAKSNVKKGVRYAKKHGKNLPKVAAKRAVTEAKKKLK